MLFQSADQLKYTKYSRDISLKDYEPKKSFKKINIFLKL